MCHSFFVFWFLTSHWIILSLPSWLSCLLRRNFRLFQSVVWQVYFLFPNFPTGKYKTLSVCLSLYCKTFKYACCICPAYLDNLRFRHSNIDLKAKRKTFSSQDNILIEKEKMEITEGPCCPGWSGNVIPPMWSQTGEEPRSGEAMTTSDRKGRAKRLIVVCPAACLDCSPCSSSSSFILSPKTKKLLHVHALFFCFFYNTLYHRFSSFSLTQKLLAL